jgi:hypothetical protein
MLAGSSGGVKDGNRSAARDAGQADPCRILGAKFLFVQEMVKLSVRGRQLAFRSDLNGLPAAHRVGNGEAQTDKGAVGCTIRDWASHATCVAPDLTVPNVVHPPAVWGAKPRDRTGGC